MYICYGNVVDHDQATIFALLNKVTMDINVLYLVMELLIWGKLDSFFIVGSIHNEVGWGKDFMPHPASAWGMSM